jgi:hypothetical protein
MIPKNSLPLVRAPEHLWTRIQSELDHPEPSYPRWWALMPLAAMIVVVLWIALQPASHWIETQQNITTIAVGDIGTVDIQPQSRVRVLATRSNEHRLELAEGAIEATINAPPRLFIVDTKATTAIDLGCAYRMESDSAGNGSLRVTGGWVALEKASGEVLVPAGANCKIRSSRGAGTPYFSDASEAFRNAVDAFDQNASGIDLMLANARPRDTLTLWHVLREVNGSERERVFDKMAALVPLPSGVTKDKVLALDAATMTRWREELAWSW